MRNISRRKFLGQASCAGLGYLTFMNSLLNLKALNSAAISDSEVFDGDDYKAIVCILLAGGNDSFNMLVPYDSASHAEYEIARSGLYTRSGNPGLAIPRSELTNTVLNYSGEGKQWAVHPSMSEVKNLFDQGKLSFLCNIGTLTNPVTKAQYENESNLPLGLYSHSDQIQQWQTGIPNGRSAKGWAGKIADMIGDTNSNDQISMNVSLSGTNIFQTGNHTIEYAIEPYDGAIGIKGYDPEPDYLAERVRTEAIDSLMGQHYDDIFKNTYKDVIKNARDGFIQFDTALQEAATFSEGMFDDNQLAASLEMTARTISIRQQLGFRRQIFFISVGGWDHHDEVIENQQQMLGMVSAAISSFQSALEDAKLGMGNQVLTMFISEFGRTLRSNGNGSDHAWGGNVMVMGGQELINGGQLYGDYPSMADQEVNPLLIESGRFIPQLSTDEYFCEVARWFGVPANDLSRVFPNIGNFYNTSSSEMPIGFIKG